MSSRAPPTGGRGDLFFYKIARLPDGQASSQTPRNDIETTFHQAEVRGWRIRSIFGRMKLRCIAGAPMKKNLKKKRRRNTNFGA
jgi:hypothetical protein